MFAFFFNKCEEYFRRFRTKTYMLLGLLKQGDREGRVVYKARLNEEKLSSLPKLPKVHMKENSFLDIFPHL